MPNVCEFMAYEGQDWKSEGKSCTKDKQIPLPQPSFLYHHQHTFTHRELGASWNYLRYSRCCQTSCLQPWRSSILILRIWYDGTECMLSARFPLHIGDPKEGLRGYWYQPLPKAPCHWNDAYVLLARTEGAQKSGGVPWAAAEIQVNILSILTAPAAQWKSIRNTASIGWKTFQKASNENMGESWASLYPGHTFQRAQWASCHSWGRPGDYS